MKKIFKILSLGVIIQSCSSTVKTVDGGKESFMNLGLFFLLSMFFLCLSCTTGEKFNGIRQGMNKESVESKLGQPDSIQQFPNSTLYQYISRMVSGWGWDRADYYVIFDTNGLVHTYGRENFQANRVQWQPALPTYDNSPKRVSCESTQLYNTTYTDCKER